MKLNKKYLDKQKKERQESIEYWTRKNKTEMIAFEKNEPVVETAKKLAAQALLEDLDRIYAFLDHDRFGNSLSDCCFDETCRHYYKLLEPLEKRLKKIINSKKRPSLAEFLKNERKITNE